MRCISIHTYIHTYIPATIKLEGPREYEEAVLDRVRTTLAECENGEFMSVDIANCNVEWSMTNKSRNKCCFSLHYCHICVSFLLWCCRVAIWPPFTFPCTRSKSTQFLSAKFFCFGFVSTNHVARNHIDKNVYGRWRKNIRFLLFEFVLRVFFAEDFGIRIDEILLLLHATLVETS